MKHLRLCSYERVNTENAINCVSRVALERHVAYSQHDQPAVIMLVSEESAQKTTECLAMELADAYSINCSESFLVSFRQCINLLHSRFQPAVGRFPKK